MKNHRVTMRGFTLVELMVTLTVLAILLGLAGPSMLVWIKNSKVRSSADSLQNGLRVAQADALRRSRQTAFSLTSNPSPLAVVTAAANGKYWSVNTVKINDASVTTDASVLIENGVLGSAGNEVQIAGPASICFSSLGRLIVNATPGTGSPCDATNIPARYDVTLTGASRPLRVTVAVGGQVRMCDPAKTLSVATPDGC